MTLAFHKIDDTYGVSALREHRDLLCALHSFSDIDSFTHFALDAVLATVSAHAGSLFLWDECAKELVQKVFRSADGGRVRDARVKLREGVAGWVADKGQPVLVKDIGQDVRFNNVKRIGTYQSPSFICLPLISNNKLLGVINITEKEDRLAFSEEDWERTAALAEHISLAYESLRAKYRLQKENEALSQSVNNLRESLKKQEPLVSVGKLASHLAHELTNPLDAIRRFVNLALDEVMEDSLAREYLLKAKKGIRRSVGVLRGLLTFSRQSHQTKVRITDLHSLIEHNIEGILQDGRFKGIMVQKLFCSEPVVIVDRGLDVVFKNILENAAYAMLEPVTNRPKKIAVSTKKEDGRVTIVIEDTGCGIPEDIQPRLFEPFFTTKRNGEGNGIGLAISRDIVERSGGEITFESSEEKGTKFLISIPCQLDEDQTL